MLSILHSLNSVVQPYYYYFQVALGEANVHVDAVVMYTCINVSKQCATCRFLGDITGKTCCRKDTLDKAARQCWKLLSDKDGKIGKDLRLSVEHALEKVMKDRLNAHQPEPLPAPVQDIARGHDDGNDEPW